MPDIWSWHFDWWRATSSTVRLRASSQVSRSPWTGRRNVYGPHVQVWVARVTLTEAEAPLWFELDAFVSRLGGQGGLIRIGDFARTRPQRDIDAATSSERFSDGTFFDDGSGFLSGPLPPTIHVTAAAAKGAGALQVGGLPASESRVLRRGDLIEIRRNGIADATASLHMVLADAPTDAAGKTLLALAPALRAGVAVGDAVALDHPTSVFQLADDEQGGFEVTPPNVGNMGFTLIEYI